MSRYLQYIHNLRGLAIIFVVGVHSGGYQIDWRSHPDIHHYIQIFFDPSEGNGTVLFLFIGGFLFQHLTHNQFDYKKYLEQKFLNIILPYIIISIPLILIRLNTNFESLSLPADFQQRSHTSQFFYHLIRGTHMPPFWFISTIVLFYFSAPILHHLDNRFFYKYGFPFVLLTCFFTYRPENNANPIYAYFHFIPIYMLGMWASFHKERLLKLEWKLLIPLAIIYTSLTILDLSGYHSIARDISFEQVITGPMIVFNIYMFKAVVLCLMLLLVFYKLRNKEMPLLEILGHYSFGVFFVHYILISITRKLIERASITIDFTLTSYLIYFMLILMLSIVTVYLVKKVSGRYSRYLIGS